MEAEAELAMNQSDDSGVGVPKSEATCQEVSNPSDSADSDAPQSPAQENASDPLSGEAQTKPVPVPAPRISFRSTDRPPLLPAGELEETEEDDSGDDFSSHNPPGFLYKVRNHDLRKTILVKKFTGSFSEGDMRRCSCKTPECVE